MSHPEFPPPAPISWEPSEYWDGFDGNWSSFHLRVGTPTQLVRVLISTAGTATWVVIPDGCSSAIPDCGESRGGLFNLSSSNTWKNNGNFSLGLETNLGYGGVDGVYGFDSLSLGLSNATGEPSLNDQVVAGLVSFDYYLGEFGLGDQPMNFTNFDHPHPSFLTTLKTNDLIPSLSWGFTAGAHYNNDFGSLTFGGYDFSKFIPNNVSFFLAGDVARDVVVTLLSITSKDSASSLSIPLQSPISTFIDSTLPYIYLPIDACKNFEKQLGLIWNNTLGLYLVDDKTHQALLASKPEFTFQIGSPNNDGSIVDIVLPYASFDLTASPPLTDQDTKYFPIQPGNESQYVLGRTFLQEAYLIVDYEHSNFSVSQRKFQGDQKNIIAINSTESANTQPATPLPSVLSDHPNTPAHLSLGAMLGIAIGAALFFILVFFIIVAIMRRRRSTRPKESNHDSNTEPTQPKSPYPQEKFALQESDNISVSEYKEIPDSGKFELQDPQTYKHPHYLYRELQVDELSEKPENKPEKALKTSQPIIYELTAESVMRELNSHWDTTKTAARTKTPTRSESAISLMTKSSRPNRTKHGKALISTPRSLNEREFFPSARRISRGLNRPLPPTPLVIRQSISRTEATVTVPSDHEKIMRRMGIVVPSVGGEF